jgi:hypothetical protein
MQQRTIANISKLLQTQSMYDLALDIGISQYSLYCYVNDFAKVSQRMKDKIQTYINKKVDKIS